MCPCAGISSCFGKDDTRSLTRGHRGGTVSCSGCVQRSESPRAALGWGGSVTQSACEIPIFPVVWISRWPRTPPPVAAGPFAGSRVARGKRQSQVWSSPGSEQAGSQAWRAEPPEQLSPGRVGVQGPARGSALLCVRTQPQQRAAEASNLPNPGSALTPGCPAPHEPCHPRIPFPKHVPCGRLPQQPGPGSPRGRGSPLGTSSQTPKYGTTWNTAQGKGTSMVVVPSRVLGPLSGTVPRPQLEGGTPLSPGTRRSAANIYPTPFPWLLPRHPPPAGWAGAPHTRRATCRATAVPRGMSPPRNDFTGSPGRRRGVRPDRPKASEGCSRKGSRAPAPILLGAGEEGGRSPAAPGELSQTSAPTSGLC